MQKSRLSAAAIIAMLVILPGSAVGAPACLKKIKNCSQAHDYCRAECGRKAAEFKSDPTFSNKKCEDSFKACLVDGTFKIVWAHAFNPCSCGEMTGLQKR